MELGLQKALFGLSSLLTDYTPRPGAQLLDATVGPLLSLPALESFVRRRNLEVLDRAGTLKKVLILSDIHLGDAVMMQGLPAAVKDYFPGVETHYAVSKAAAPYVEGHPDVDVLHPLFTGGLLPSEADLKAVGDLLAGGDFDLVINACPFFNKGRPLPKEGKLLDYMTWAPRIVRNEIHPGEPNHFMFQAHRFLIELFQERHSPKRAPYIRGGQLFLDDAAVDAADAYLSALPDASQGGWTLLNPDGASPYTRPPESLLASLLELLVRGGARVLVGEGFTDRGVGIRLRESLTPALRARTFLVPSTLPGPAYAALLDRMDVVISGDTGPLHWAAARKNSRTGRREFRNRTTLISLFGATPARMSGYDSYQPGFMAAWQGAPSRTFISRAPCRNLTCLNKLNKKCRTLRCFFGLAPEPVAEAAFHRLFPDAVPSAPEAAVPVPA